MKKQTENLTLFSKRMLDRDKNLLISISGIRGTIPEGLDPENITQFALAFASVTGKTIVIGNDSRLTGDAIRKIFIGVLISCGKKIIDVGLAPTPTIKAAVHSFGADAGVIISASHNPLNWNGFKFLAKGGFFFDKKKIGNLIAAIEKQNYKLAKFSGFGLVQQQDAIKSHIKSVLKVLPNLEQIRDKNYTVVVDAVDGAGREALPALLKELNCKVIALYCSKSEKFPRPPEPTPVALKEFGKLVQKKQAAAGFALDPDADRLVCATPGRGCINEEYTLALALSGITSTMLKKAKTNSVVVNLSTSMLTDFVANKKKLTVFRSAVGEANVVALMKKKRALFGGEGNGGVIHSGIPSFGRDPLIGSALILSVMASRNLENLDCLMNDLPNLYMKKTKYSLPNNTKPEDLYKKILKIFPDGQKDTRDGLHLQLPGKSNWLHIRPSNTEPVVRLIVEASGKKKLNSILNQVENVFK